MNKHFLHAILSACLLAASAGTAMAKTIRIVAGSSPVFAPVFVADQKGYFKEQGLDVTVRPFTSGAEATEGFRSGAADFLVASDVPLLYLLSGGDTVMLGQFSANPDMLLVMGAKGMAGPASLKGKRIGLVTKSSSEYLLNQYLRSAGMTLADVQRVSLAPFDQVSALLRGDVDALSTWKPFDSKILQMGKGKFAIETWGEKQDYVLYSGIVTKRDFLASNRDDTVKIMKALKKAADFLAASDIKKESAPLASYLKSTPEDVASVIAHNQWGMAVTPRFLGTMQSIEAFLADGKLISRRVDWNSAYDWSILKEVDASLVPSEKR